MKKKYIILAAILLVGAITVAATWDMSITRLTSLWVGSSSDTSTNQVGKDDVYIKGTLEVDGVIYVDGGFGNSNIETIQMPLGAAITKFTDSAASPIQQWQEGFPGLVASYAVPAILWASGEDASIGWTFTLPANYSSGLSFRMINHTTVQGSPTLWSMNWFVFVGEPGASIGSTPFIQASVPNSVVAPASKNVLFTFTPDATAQASLAAGNFVTVFFQPIDERVVGYFGTKGTTEMRALEARYTPLR